MDPQIQDLLAPLTEREVDGSARRFQIDREKLVSRMVEVSLAPEARFGPAARALSLLALAASLALASWGGVKLWQQRSGAASGVEVSALRGAVTSRPGVLETAAGAEARITTDSGIQIQLLESSRVALGGLSSAGNSALRLERGQVRCVVQHQPGRTFSVETADARVVDVGTTFTVGVEDSEAGPRTVVRVEVGEVLVQHGAQQSRLHAAQSWTSAMALAPSPAAVEQAPVAPPVEEAHSAPGPRRDALKRRQTLAAETELLQSGLANEQKGDLRGAVGAFQALLARYPDSQLAPDAKAALSRVQGRLESSK